jgi:hypothetical protein
MTHRLLHEGPNTTYPNLVGSLRESEVLIATWSKHDKGLVRLVPDRNEFYLIARTAKRRKTLLRFFASTTGAGNYYDFNNPDTLLDEPTIVAPALADGWPVPHDYHWAPIPQPGSLDVAWSPVLVDAESVH